MIPRILIIAGSDSGGGAGVQADIKTVTMLGGHAMTAITAITAQNTLGVQAVMPVPAEMVLEQMASVIEDLGVDAIKIGMLPNEEIVRAVAGGLVAAYQVRGRARAARQRNAVPIVLDPVLVATSGDALATAEVARALVQRLAPLATVVTPNMHEAKILFDIPGFTDIGVPILLKGGHGPGDDVTDVLLNPDGSEQEWANPRIVTRHTHGTGCTLASAIAAGLGSGLLLSDAITRAIAYVRASIAAAPGYGGGHGPMGHNLGLAPFDLLRSST